MSENRPTDIDAREAHEETAASDERAVSGEPVLPQVSSDERDEGWGDDPPAGRRDEQWYRRERPPHHE